MLSSLRRPLATAALACASITLVAQSWPFPWPEGRIAQYTARRATAPIVVDGRLDEAALIVAWAYVAIRAVHSAIHLTYNNVMHRLTAFALSNFVLMAFWVLFFV